MALAREHFKKRSRPRRRPDDAGEASVRERILSAAFAAVMERGYSGASTLEIATRAKVSKCRASAIALHHLHSSGTARMLQDACLSHLLIEVLPDDSGKTNRSGQFDLSKDRPRVDEY
jgi:Bacterial regulatory proteins, tetR family